MKNDSRPVCDGASFPLTREQLGIYLACASDPDGVTYNIPVLCRLPRKTDKTRFIAAVKKAVNNHKALFCTVAERGGVPSMTVSDRTVCVTEEEASDPYTFAETFRRPFDLERGPLCRFVYLTTPVGDAFLFDIHHIIFDGSSFGVLLRDVAAAYRGEPLTPEAVTLFDVATKQAEKPDEDAKARYLAYFDETLGSLDGDSKPVPDYLPKESLDGGATLWLPIGTRFTTREVESFTASNGITENALFLGAFGYTLAHCNGTTECFFSTAHHGRTDKRLASTVGMFVKTLPFSCRFAETDTTLSLLKKAYDSYYFLKENDCLSFADIASKYGLKVDVSFVYQSSLFDGVALEGETVRYEMLDDDNAVASLEVMLFKDRDGYRAGCHYRLGDYTEGFVRSFLLMFASAVRGMMSARTLGEIDLLDRESEALLDVFNRTEKTYDTNKTVVDLFRERARLAPDAECLVFEKNRYSYREVDRLTDRLAAYLASVGIGRGSVVGVLIPRSEQMLLCSLGVLKAGAAYMPLDPSYPAERLRLMMSDSGASMLMTTPALSDVIPDSFTGRRFDVSDVFSLPEASCLPAAPLPDDLFVLLYTSGSTGTPKGVMFAHSNVMVTAAWERDFYRLGAGCNVTAYASYGFDANVFDTYATVTSGAALHIISDDIRLDLVALRDYFNENNITHATMTTQVGRQFALMGGHKTLKVLNVAGEKLTPLVPPEGFDLYNLYGPTEGSILVSGFLVDRAYKDVPIGNALDNVKLYVVDPLGRRLPPCAAGELWISGAHVTKGYLNRPEKTAEAYGENPFCREPGYETVYRTGDIVRMDCDGNLQFIGRRDGQAKVRGFRVELTEVEEVIRRFDGIRDATVAAFDDPAGGKFIAAYVVSDSAVDVGALNAFILSEKPSYMVPAVTMQIDRIPLNQNQKVNRKALPYPERKAEAVVLPETKTQKTIMRLAADVLGHEQFGIDTDLFDAGLTSVGTLRLNVLLSEAFDTAVRLDDLRSHPTVRALDAFLKEASDADGYAVLDDYPLTQTQKGIFVECSADPGSVAYNIPLLLRLSDEVDAPKLVDAVRTAIDAHPYCKTRLFADENGELRARRNDGEAPEVAFERRASLPPQSELVRPFALMGERLYRAAVYRTDAGLYLFADFHHIISDGTSEAVLLRDIDRAYAGLPVTKETYTGYEIALDEEKARASDRYGKAKAYFESVFGGVETESLPPRAPESKTAGAATVRKRFRVRADRIDAFCSAHKLTPNAFFNAAFGFTLSRFGQSGDAVFATVYNGRSDSRSASSVTMLVKTLPVLVRASENRPVVDLIRETQNVLINGMENDVYSFAEIAASLGVRSDVLFVYQGDSFTFDRLCGAPAEPVYGEPDSAKAPLSLTVSLVGGGYDVSAEYRTDVFCQSFVMSFTDAFDEVLKAFTEKENLADVSFLSEEAEKTIAHHNDTFRPLDGVTLCEMAEKHAALHPDRLAVVAAGKRLTFGEMNGLANRMARSLVSLGVGEETVVAMMLDRTCDLPVAELAILKAGGAFLGLLPSYPDDRIDYCLTDAHCPLVITTRDIAESRLNLFSADKPYRAVFVEDLLKNDCDDDLRLVIRGDAPAYCIYTSGSTGKPKGVVVERRNLECCAKPFDFSYRYYHGAEGGSVSLGLSSVTFDMSVFDTLLNLLNGKTVVIATEYEIHNPAELARLMTDNHVDMMAGTPSVITNYIGLPAFRDALRSLKTLVSGAEAFPASLYATLRELSPSLHILNGYGPSECTMTCCAKVLTDGESITIGKPSANTAFYVMDRFGHILPPYACGELIIAGGLVGRGYINLPEKTAASFFTLNGMRAYHSGDTVRMNGDGEIEFFGRQDNQVKLRGFRVELDEIEKCMMSFDGVRQSKVIVRHNESGDYLAGFFTADHPVDIGTLTSYLKTKLTYYMVPDCMAQLEAMPLTPSGKIDKKALPEIRRESRKTGRRAPKQSTEEMLCELFSAVLSLDEYYADDNFFENGGTSLSASKVTMQLMAKGIKVEYQDIFDRPTPEALAAFIDASSAVAAPVKTEENEDKKNEFDDVLRRNALEYAQEVCRMPLGDVLLTGASGFLGIHVLKELIARNEGRIVCLIRQGDAPSPDSRLKNMLMYYFGSTFEDAFGTRIVTVNADITDPDLSAVLKDTSFDTLINCAACVKHYAADDTIERINVRGVENLIRVAREKNARMVQISTVSVPGVHTAETYASRVVMHENELFVIDDMDNKYCISKYHAERKMLEAIRGGLRGKIIRVGNLMGRHSDGEFQINFNTNAFLNALRGFATLGKCPVSHATDPMRFSPVDMTAAAIVLLAGTNDEFTAFHADNRFGFDEMQLIESCNRCGVKIVPTDDKEYYADYYRMLGDESVNSRLSGLVTNDRPDLHAVETDNTFTANVLYRLGFSWPFPDSRYLDRTIESLLTLDYFETED